MGEAWDEGGHWIAFPDFGSWLFLSLSGMKRKTLRAPYLRRSSEKGGFVSRGSISFGSFWSVAGLLTVDGNR